MTDETKTEEQDQQTNGGDPKDAVRLEENDFLKMRLINRNVDLFEMQIELSQMKLLEAQRMLQEVSEALMMKYGVQDARQINGVNGEIFRMPAEGSQENEQS